jgi:putative restriction endonuclease
MDKSLKSTFQAYLHAENREGSGKAASYIRALELLDKMLHLAPLGFEDCRDIWVIESADRLIELRQQVLEEQKKGPTSPWVDSSIPISYLRDGYCSAALAQLIEFLPQNQHAGKALDLLREHHGDTEELAAQLNALEPQLPKAWSLDPTAFGGTDRLHEVKTRIGQHAFREVILELYQNRCCVTGIEIPALNRASHIIGWAERSDTRMDPRNGLCLSATYDAAFDRKLITVDNDYRLVLSKTIKEHMTSQSLRTHFLNREGQRIELPTLHPPLQDYLETHRKGGDF